MISTSWLLRGRRKYITAVLLVADLCLGGFSAAMAVGSRSAQHPAAATTSSATTVSWTTARSTYDPAYADATHTDPGDHNQSLYGHLQVSVSQTQDLTDQGLQVSWTGAPPTGGGGAPDNYMQIMQCWAGKNSTGPTPQQCQWGTPNASLAGQMGLSAASRDLLTGPQADPKQLPSGNCTAEFTHAQFGQSPGCTVPFWSITDPHKSALGWTNDQYNLPPYGAAQSNEVSYARTAADGSGQYIFSLQSALSAPYLGCGNPTYAAAGDTCWLVVVPRGEYNPNGELASTESQTSGYGSNFNYVAGTPLSATAWQDRVEVPLRFTPIGASCQLGASAVRTAGSELVAAAFSSWQAALCGRGSTFGYSEITDNQARMALTSGGTSMSFLGSPLDSATAGSSTTDYAPVAASAIVVSYLIDKNYVSDNANPDIGADGTLVTNLRLTPLIIAKLLTQSYKSDTPGDGRGVDSSVPASNPDSLLQDQDFLALNPEFKYFFRAQIPQGLIIPFGDSDAAAQIWAWLRSDPDTKKFLNGQSVDGATINGAYKSLSLDTDTTVNSFPKNDQSTFRTGDWPAPGFGTLDLRPYAADLTDGALKTVAANAGEKTNFDATLTPPQATSVGPQTPGTRFVLALTTSQAAALYGLPTAALVTSPTDTSAGVTATTSSMAKELAGASVATATTGVKAVDPSVAVDGGYPLTMRTYAAVNRCATAPSDLTADATFLDYAAGSGQDPGTKLGQLPLGYASLTSADQAQTAQVASALRSEVTSPKCPSVVPSSGSTAPGTSSGAGSSGSGSGSSAATGTGATAPPGSAQVPSGQAAAAPVSVVPVGSAGVTPDAYVTAATRYALLAAFLFFLPCAVFGPTLLVSARRRN
ncbi:MAG: hypothetical protein JWQ32_3456 [Marmoricola sp.]|nr:hypothetical protein [Marmoricola sp.]